LNYFLSVLISYLLGSVNFSYLAGKLLKGIDIRQHGSGNAGATNTLRILGKGPGISVFVLDILKGVFAVVLAVWFVPDSLFMKILCGIAVVAGHNWPIFFNFKGGKGIATTIGVMITICPIPVIFAGILAIIAIIFTRYVSLGSLIFAAALPFFVWWMHKPAEIIWVSLVIAIFAFYSHRTNIVKLLNGKENKLGAKR
jgi:glycerol-3-phosphate acyltransferase PlsY